MKRRDLMRELRKAARERGEELLEVEGARHTKVSIGDKRTVVPRHSEINENTAREILQQMGVRSR